MKTKEEQCQKRLFRNLLVGPQPTNIIHCLVVVDDVQSNATNPASECGGDELYLYARHLQHLLPVSLVDAMIVWLLLSGASVLHLTRPQQRNRCTMLSGRRLSDERMLSSLQHIVDA